MRDGERSLLPGHYCEPCPLAGCEERDTDAACTPRGARRNAVHPGRPEVFAQWIRRAGAAPDPKTLRLPELPLYIPRANRDAKEDELAAIPGAAVGFSIGDFLALGRRAMRVGRPLRRALGAEGRLLVVIGADPDRACHRWWMRRWPQTVAEIAAFRPDALVPPDLGLFGDDEPAQRLLNHNSHAVMTADMNAAGIPAIMPVSWTRPSDLRRAAEWVERYRVPALYVDLQHWGRATRRKLDEFGVFRDLFPDDLVWMINGSVGVEVWAQLTATFGDVRVTGAGAWHDAKTRHSYAVERGRLRRVRTSDQPFEALLRNDVQVLLDLATRTFRKRRVRHLRIRPLSPRALPSAREAAS